MLEVQKEMKSFAPAYKQKRPISVVSSFADDIVYYGSLSDSQRCHAGPAFYISKVLQKEGLDFKLISEDSMVVEILVTPSGELGKVPVKPSTKKIPSKLSDWAIISTVLNEWDIASIRDWPTFLFVDLQGYVRDGDDFGKKRIWKDIAQFADKIFCLKGTREEIGQLPPLVLQDQKKRLLLITNGDKGVDVYYRGTHTYVPSGQIIRSNNTIGAGDTFLAYFVSAMFRGDNPVKATRYASERTALFLKGEKSLGLGGQIERYDHTLKRCSTPSKRFS